MAQLIKGGLRGPTSAQMTQANIGLMGQGMKGLSSLGQSIGEMRDAKQTRQDEKLAIWMADFDNYLTTNYNSDVTALAADRPDLVYDYYYILSNGDRQAAEERTAGALTGKATPEGRQAMAFEDMMTDDMMLNKTTENQVLIDEQTRLGEAGDIGLIERLTTENKALADAQAMRAAGGTTPFAGSEAGADPFASYFGNRRQQKAEAGSKQAFLDSLTRQTQGKAESEPILPVYKQMEDGTTQAFREDGGPWASDNPYSYAEPINVYPTYAGGKPPEMAQLENYEKVSGDKHELAMVSPDETIMNPVASQMFAPELAAMQQLAPNPYAELAPDTIPMPGGSKVKSVAGGTNVPVKAEGDDAIARLQGLLSTATDPVSIMQYQRQLEQLLPPSHPMGYDPRISNNLSSEQIFNLTPGLATPRMTPEELNMYFPQGNVPQQLLDMWDQAEAKLAPKEGGVIGSRASRSRRPVEPAVRQTESGRLPTFAGGRNPANPSANPNGRPPEYWDAMIRAESGGLDVSACGKLAVKAEGSQAPEAPVMAGGGNVPVMAPGGFASSLPQDTSASPTSQYRDAQGNYIGPVANEGWELVPAGEVDLNTMEVKKDAQGNPDLARSGGQEFVLVKPKTEVQPPPSLFANAHGVDNPRIAQDYSGYSGPGPTQGPITEEGSWRKPMQEDLVDAQRMTDREFNVGVSPPDQEPSGYAPTAGVGMVQKGDPRIAQDYSGYPDRPMTKEEEDVVVKEKEDEAVVNYRDPIEPVIEKTPSEKGHIAQARKWISTRPANGSFNASASEMFMNTFYPEGIDILDYMGDVYKAKEARQRDETLTQAADRLGLDKDKFDQVKLAENNLMDRFTRELALDRDKFLQTKDYQDALIDIQKATETAKETDKIEWDRIEASYNSFQDEIDAYTAGNNGDVDKGLDAFYTSLLSSKTKRDAYVNTVNRRLELMGMTGSFELKSGPANKEENLRGIARIGAFLNGTAQLLGLKPGDPDTMRPVDPVGIDPNAVMPQNDSRAYVGANYSTADYLDQETSFGDF